ncbi:MAG: Crp/Fnr family transcriptional regulator [Sphingomonadaceae bacterium]|nr:Crp/Fnr family transcriptional regulator [Sphingomonadaceae bacterium]
MADSCIAARLSHFLALTEEEASALARLEENPRDYRRGEMIGEQGAPADELFIIRSGWAYSHISFDGERRQILRLEFPGDLMGTSSIAFGKASDNLTAVTDCTLCPLDRPALRQLFIDHCRLAALLFVISQAERVSMDDRLASIGRSSAKSRIAALLLDILVRFRIMHGEDLDRVEIPMTQEEIGDATGLTPVHVNRMLQELSRDELISRKKNEVHILDEVGLVELAEYINRYADVDTSWLPPPEA